ncbi:MAG TPA: hypothetical protein VE821_01565 [Pyrinomonadaceae bacterium]|nr:hypothetical protein [Pyrinomonadaceae bacterium]
MGKTKAEKKGSPQGIATENVLASPSDMESSIITDPTKLEGLRQWYTEVNEYIRHYATLRFAIMTVYLAALGGIIAVAFSLVEIKAKNIEQIKFWGRLAGLLTTVLFFIYECRVQSLINFRLKVGRELEAKLGYKHLTLRPSWGYFRTHHFTIGFYALLVLFWFWMAVRQFRHLP